VKLKKLEYRAKVNLFQ